MAIPEGLTCEICLRPDENQAMLHVPIEQRPPMPDRDAVICRRCAGEIGAALIAAHEAENPEEKAE